MIILGVDGGGTKTYALALDEHGNVIGSAIGGPSGYHVIGLETAVNEIVDVSQRALHGKQADVVVMCLGDCDSPTDHQRLMEALSARQLATRLTLYNDAFAALRAGSTRSYGVAVVCGTGFNACGIARDGQTAKLYALGPLTGDWGGGSALGVAMFGAAFRADDGRGPATSLTDMLLTALNAPDLATVADRITERDYSNRDLGKLAPLVFEAAEGGDAAARAIVIRQADEIAVSALALLRRLEMTQVEVDVVLSGGVVYGQGSLLLARVTEQIQAVCPKASIRRLAVPPVIGAAFLAIDQLGLPTPDIARYQHLLIRRSPDVVEIQAAR
jgi:N-acetylglucosamine kinase-like BadF-type ATPase